MKHFYLPGLERGLWVIGVLAGEVKIVLIF
jgi:hypothetical protein